MKNIQSILIPLTPCLLLASCCEMDIDQQCYRQGGSSMVGGLGNAGYRAATTNTHKGFQRVGFPSTSRTLDVDVSEMKLVNTAKGEVKASGSATYKAMTEANVKVGTSWDNKSDMLVRIFEFANPIELIAELNRPENSELRSHLKMRDKEARIITRVVRAYDHSEVDKRTYTGELEAKFLAGKPNGKINYENSTSRSKSVADGTIIGYQWARIIWSSKDSDQVSHISLDTVFLD